MDPTLQGVAAGLVSPKTEEWSSAMGKRPGDWVKESLAADCPVCGDDSIGVRPLESGDTELRRCDGGHEFVAKAWQWAKPSEATRFD